MNSHNCTIKISRERNVPWAHHLYSIVDPNAIPGVPSGMQYFMMFIMFGSFQLDLQCVPDGTPGITNQINCYKHDESTTHSDLLVRL